MFKIFKGLDEALSRQNACLETDGRGVQVLPAPPSDRGSWQAPLALQKAFSQPGRFGKPPRIDLPSALDFLEGATCQEWLLEELEWRIGSPYMFDQAVALGLVKRLWTPTNREERAGLIQGLLAGETESPPERIARWAVSLPQPSIDRLKRQAIDALDDLYDRLEAVHNAVASDLPKATQLLGKALLSRRDDLESVVGVLRPSGNSEFLEAGLASFDKIAESNLFTLGMIEGLEGSDRLRAVAWQYPKAWWGAPHQA